MTNGRFDHLFGGAARKPESKLTQRDMDLARSIQEVTEEIVLRLMPELAYERPAPRISVWRVALH